MIVYICCLHTRQHHSGTATAVAPGVDEKVRGATRHLLLQLRSLVVHSVCTTDFQEQPDGFPSKAMGSARHSLPSARRMHQRSTSAGCRRSRRRAQDAGLPLPAAAAAPPSSLSSSASRCAIESCRQRRQAQAHRMLALFPTIGGRQKRMHTGCGAGWRPASQQQPSTTPPAISPSPQHFRAAKRHDSLPAGAKRAARGHAPGTAHGRTRCMPQIAGRGRPASAERAGAGREPIPREGRAIGARGCKWTGDGGALRSWL